MSKQILCMVSEWGYWGEELVGPYDVLLDNGYTIDFMTAKGRKPPALPPSMEPGYLDPPLDKVVTDEHYASRTREIHESDLLADPIDLSSWFPALPYFNGPSFGHELEDYYNKLDKAIAASKKGMAFVHVFSPCPTGWRFDPGKLIEVSRKAVETNLVPLWEYDNAKRALRFTRSVDNPLPSEEYLKLVGKYRHLNDEQIAHIQKMADERIELLKSFTEEASPLPAVGE